MILADWVYIQIIFKIANVRREAKDEETREIKAEANRVKQERQKLEIRKKREKEEATARAVQEWNDQKERAQSKINTPQHISPFLPC